MYGLELACATYHTIPRPKDIHLENVERTPEKVGTLPRVRSRFTTSFAQLLLPVCLAQPSTEPVSMLPLFLSLTAASSVKLEDGVAVLTPDNFDDWVKSQEVPRAATSPLHHGHQSHSRCCR